MKHMIALIAGVIVLFILTVWDCPLAGAQVIHVVVYADESYPPYSYAEGGKIKGIYTDILQKAFTQMDGFQITIEAQPWKRILAMIEAGEYFAFYPPYFLPQERPYVDPYSVPILEEQVSLLCAAQVMIQKREDFPEDFYGLTFANNAGFRIGGGAFLEAVKAGKITIEEATTTEQNLRKLSAGRVDCYINDRTAMLSTLKSLQQQGIISQAVSLVEGPIVKTEMGYVGYAKQSDNFPFKLQFIEQLNQILLHMKKHGDIERILDEYVR